MAIIYSYPLNKNIKLSDELVGTTEQIINGRLKTVTRNFLLSDLGEFFTAGGGLQAKIILTTTGSSGPATLDDITGVLNIPEYLSGTVTSITALSPLTGGTITNSGSIGIQIASGTQSGALSFANWNTFNNKQNLITLTVNGSSGAATFNQTTGALNIPQYSGSTNLGYIASVLNGIVTSSTGLDATIPLADSTNAGLLKPAKFTVLENTSGTNTGDQNLQSVTNIGASTTNPINVNVTGVSTGLQSGSTSGKGIFGYSNTSIGVEGYSQTGIGVRGYSEDEVGGSFETEGTTANIANFIKSGVVKAFINNAGELTAQKLIKQGGTSSEILAADGSIITAGNNITITGGTISSVGGAGKGGSSVNYYLNGGTSQGTFGGTTYYEFSKTAVIGTGADFSRGTNGYIASFITDVADPSLLLIPAGNWNLEFFFSSSSAGGSPSFYVELFDADAVGAEGPA